MPVFVFAHTNISRTLRSAAWALLVFIGIPLSSSSNDGCVGAVAGIPLHAYSDGQLARGARLPALIQGCADPELPGSLFLSLGDRILFADASGALSHVAGGGNVTLTPRITVPGTLISLVYPFVETGGPRGELFITDSRGAIEALDVRGAGDVRLVAGSISAGSSSSPDWTKASKYWFPASKDGTPGTSARISQPYCLTIASNGDVYFCDVPSGFGGARYIRRIRSSGPEAGLLQTVAGNGTTSFAVDGAADARLSGFSGIIDAYFDSSSGTLLVAEQGPWVLHGFISNSQISRVTPAGAVHILAGNVSSPWKDWFVTGAPALSASLSYVTTVCAGPPGDDAVYFAEFPRVVRIKQGVLTVVAGQATNPIVSYTWGAVIDGSDGPASNLGDILRIRPDPYFSSLIITDVAAGDVYRLRLLTGVIDCIAGPTLHTDIKPSPPGSGIVLATQAGFPAPNDITVDPATGDVYAALTPSHVIARLSARDGSIVVVAGTGFIGCGPSVVTDATTAALADPYCATLDGKGGLIICDYANCLMRHVDLASGSMRVIAGDVSRRCEAATSDAAHVLYADVPIGTRQMRSDIVGSANYAAVDPDTGDIYWTEYWPARVMVLRAASGLIYRVAGNGAFAEASATNIALNAALQGPYTIKVDTDGSIFFLDGFYSLLRLQQNGTLEIFARMGWVEDLAAGSVDGPLTTATAYTLAAFVITPDHRYLVADCATGAVSWAVIREIDPVAGTIQRIAGSFSDKQSVSPRDAYLGYITAIAVQPGGGILLADSSWKLLWAVLSATSEAAYCPSGYSCSCGTPEPCMDAAYYCPTNRVNPVNVTRGFYATSSLNGSDGSILFTSQAPCPIGSFCVNGTRQPCWRGTYGTSTLQAGPKSCPSCPAGYYSASPGSVGSQACLPCPAGSFAASRGSITCSLCPLGTASTVIGASNASVCRHCGRTRNGEALFAAPGATACLPLNGASMTSLGTKANLQSKSAFVGYSNKSLMLWLVLLVCAPIALASLIPCFILLADEGCERRTGTATQRRTGPALPEKPQVSTRHTRFLHRLRANLVLLDNFALQHPTKPSQSPVKRPTDFGGATTIFAGGCLSCLAAALIIQYLYANSIVTTSLLPASLAVHTFFSGVPPYTLEGGTTASFAPPTLQKGVDLRVLTIGPACGVLSAPPESKELLAGAFTSSIVSSDALTGGYVHAFTCSECAFGPQSTLTLTFPIGCQTYVFTATSVGGTGSVYTAVATAANDATIDSAESPTLIAVDVTLNPQLEVLQDEVANVTARGYGILAASTVAHITNSSSSTPPAHVTVTLSWAADTAYVLTVALPVMSAYQLISSVIGLFGIFGGFGLSLQVMRTIRNWGQGSAKPSGKSRASDELQGRSSDATGTPVPFPRPDNHPVRHSTDAQTPVRTYPERIDDGPHRSPSDPHEFSGVADIDAVVFTESPSKNAARGGAASLSPRGILGHHASPQEGGMTRRPPRTPAPLTMPRTAAPLALPPGRVDAVDPDPPVNRSAVPAAGGGFLAARA